MKPEPDIVLYTIPLCPRCVAAKRHLSEITKEHPEITVMELSMLTNMGTVMKHGLLTAPAILVRGKPMKGKVTRQTIEGMLFDEQL